MENKLQLTKKNIQEVETLKELNKLSDIENEIVKCFGNNNEYLSYIIKKENFKYLPIKLTDFDYIDLIYNQLTKEIILDCFGKNDVIMKINIKPIDFFKILYEIKAKDM